MTILAQSLFALVSRHLVSFLLFTVWHRSFSLTVLYKYPVPAELCLFYFSRKDFRRFEGRHLVLGDYYRCVFRDVAGRLGSAFFEDKAAEAAQIDILAALHRCLHYVHHSLNGCQGCCLVYTRSSRYLRYDFCFCHTRL